MNWKDFRDFVHRSLLRALEEQQIEEQLANTRIPPRDPARAWADSGEWAPVGSSNVRALMYESLEEKLWVEFNDGSIYYYHPIAYDKALAMFNTPSHGSWVWDKLRIRGTVFGYKVAYVMVQGPTQGRRWWMATGASRQRHGEIPPSGRDSHGHVIQPRDLHQPGD